MDIGTAPAWIYPVKDLLGPYRKIELDALGTHLDRETVDVVRPSTPGVVVVGHPFHVATDGPNAQALARERVIADFGQERPLGLTCLSILPHP